MFVDEAGTIWLANPWMTAALLTSVVGLMVWCHRWLETGTAPLIGRSHPEERATAGRVTRLRTLPQQATAQRHVAPLLSFRSERTAGSRSRRLNKLARTA
jgi:hypothetical protein